MENKPSYTVRTSNADLGLEWFGTFAEKLVSRDLSEINEVMAQRRGINILLAAIRGHVKLDLTTALKDITEILKGNHSMFLNMLPKEFDVTGTSKTDLEKAAQEKDPEKATQEPPKLEDYPTFSKAELQELSSNPRKLQYEINRIMEYTSENPSEVDERYQVLIYALQECLDYYLNYKMHVLRGGVVRSKKMFKMWLYLCHWLTINSDSALEYDRDTTYKVFQTLLTLEQNLFRPLYAEYLEKSNSTRETNIRNIISAYAGKSLANKRSFRDRWPFGRKQDYMHGGISE